MIMGSWRCGYGKLTWSSIRLDYKCRVSPVRQVKQYLGTTSDREQV